MKELFVVILLTAAVSIVCFSASERLVNRTGSTAIGVSIEFSKSVRITDYDTDVLVSQEPLGRASEFTFSGGHLSNGESFSISWIPNTAEITSVKWKTSAGAPSTGTATRNTDSPTYKEIMAQIAEYPGADELLYKPASDEAIWLTDLEGHADIYDDDSIKINYADWFDQSQISKIEVYRNGIKMRFLPAKFDVLTNDQMKTFDGNPAEHTPKSNHTDHAIFGYEYEFRILAQSSERFLVKIKSPFEFTGSAFAFVGHNFFDWLTLPDSALLDALKSLEDVGFAGISLGANHFMNSNVATDMFAQYTYDPAVCEAWKRTPTENELRRMMRLANQAGLDVEFRVELWLTDAFKESHGGWRGAIDPTNVNQWFANYGDLCTRLATIAEEEGADIFVVGVELNSLERYTDRWRELVSSMRHVFHGKITFAEATNLYLAGYSTYDNEDRLDRNVGSFWGTLDLIEVNMWPGAGGNMKLEERTDQRFTVLLQNLLDFWSPAFSLYRTLYPQLPIRFGEIGTFDYDGAMATDDFYGAWLLPNAKLDHQEYVDTWAAYLCMATALSADGLSAWTVTLDVSSRQWIGTHQLNQTPALYAFRAIMKP